MATSITIWTGCNPQLANSISAFLQAWEPYSAQSRRYSIFRLLHDLIDPAWNSFCERHSDLNIDRLDAAWANFQWEQFRNLAPDNIECETAEDKLVRWKKAFIPCIGKTNNSYSISLLTKHHDFNAADSFLRKIIKYTNDGEVIKSVDSMRYLLHACREKKPKKHTLSGRKPLNILLAKVACRVCGKKPELTEYLEENIHLAEDDVKNKDKQLKNRRPPISALYCSDHRPNDPITGGVRKEYLKTKRNLPAFDRELDRIERQSMAGTAATYANSGNSLVDDFILRLVVQRCLTYEQQSLDQLDTIGMRLRGEARELIDKKISDRKKEIVMLLSSGLNQSETALRLGFKNRQSVSKYLQSIPLDYRLDILCPPTVATKPT